MAIIGLLLLAAASVFGIEFVIENNFSIDVDAFNQGYTTSISLVFVAGLVTGLAAALGVMLLRDGMVRRRRHRLEAREAEEHRERHIAALEEEHAAYHRTDGEGERVDGDREREPVDLRDRDRVTTF
ncbi:MAG: hypothetical protein QOD38_1332 [Acidimicrobiaceae bacterium]